MDFFGFLVVIIMVVGVVVSLWKSAFSWFSLYNSGYLYCYTVCVFMAHGEQKFKN